MRDKLALFHLSKTKYAHMNFKLPTKLLKASKPICPHILYALCCILDKYCLARSRGTGRLPLSTVCEAIVFTMQFNTILNWSESALQTHMHSVKVTTGFCVLIS
ncbi:hypothetical protein F441_10502 [Phytophthora nicotianae CJ01A1]|uniref:Uncharacterized protein n=2 Tax=Phytophthora nicotianae TaxID=4792 RepID=W2R928_PHYN3|nr:hypothetical protein PPTG_21158 [Phytophthora nicotianae INRA-310]ETN21882.1 hypothetical protein PPTG_21158 [Phytophthora nicotianae INRA-310]ETP14594.1 hypothetical protein F441_10502 [Phytophthora nicotianae CJ01A1]